MAGRIHSETDGINEINITPFVDVMLVLLILFMISTPALVFRGLRVALPKTKTGEDLSHVTLRIYVKKTGEIYLDSRQVSPEELKNAAATVKKAGSSMDALIFADREVSHGRVMEVSDTLRELGALEVGFGANKK